MSRFLVPGIDQHIADQAAVDINQQFIRYFSQAVNRLGVVSTQTGTVYGVEEVKANIAAAKYTMLMASAEGSKMMQGVILRAAKAMCPYESGDLYDSGHPESDEGNEMSVDDVDPDAIMSRKWLVVRTPMGVKEANWYRVAFDSDHALVVHENARGYPWSSFRQDTNPDPKYDGQPCGPQFLRRALDLNADRLGERVRLMLTASLAAVTSTIKPTPRPVLAGAGAPRLVRR